MGHRTTMFNHYLVRFAFRLCVLILTAYCYFIDREALDFTQNDKILHPVNLLWLIFLVSFAFQLNPKSRVSRGCLKQFPDYFYKIETAVDDFRFRAKLDRLDLGATRVGIVWAILNLAIACCYFKKLIGVPEMLLLATFYYVCDVVCIVFYCPFQHLFMKNKCCVTCRIFAWGTIMISTPLIFVPHFYSWSVVGLALVCTALWEVTFYRHPERFCEETNAFLACENCTDHLCLIKKARKKVP